MSTVPGIRRTLIITAALATTLTLSGCSIIQSFMPAQRDGETGEVVAGGNADVFSIKVGDCINEDNPDAEEVSNVPAVPCTESHDYEVFHEFKIEGDTFPGAASIDEQGTTGCESEFQSFAGIAYADSALDYSFYYPTQASWDDGDRLISCIIMDPAGKITGTLAGAAR